MLILSQVDDPQKSTYDVPHSNVPVVTAPTSDDGVNWTTQHPTVGCHISCICNSMISCSIWN